MLCQVLLACFVQTFLTLVASDKRTPTQASKALDELYMPSESFEQLYTDTMAREYSDGLGLGSISEAEAQSIIAVGGNPVYGEISPEGVGILIAALNVTETDTVYDLGSGFGRFLVQTFLEIRVARAVGVELSGKRHEVRAQHAVSCDFTPWWRVKHNELADR